MRRNYSVTPALMAWRKILYMQWLIIGEDDMDRYGDVCMVEEEVFIRGEGIEECIGDVLRLRGGALLRSGFETNGRFMSNLNKLDRVVGVAKVALRTAKTARSAPISETLKAVGEIYNSIAEEMTDGPVQTIPSQTTVETIEQGAHDPENLTLRGGEANTTILGGIDTVSLRGETIKMFKFQKLLHTAYQYTMSPVRFYTGGSPNHHNCKPGVGPCLYWQTDETLANSTSTEPNPNFAKLRPFDIADLTSDTDPLFGTCGTCYVFCADWFGKHMNYDEFTLSRLQWIVDDTTATSDPNTAIKLEDLIGVTSPNKDWSVIRHYATYIEFEFTNLSPQPYVVEVLFFKFKVDPDEMTWTDQLRAPMSNQNDVHAYCENSIRNFGTEQITVMKRHRQRIYGLDNFCHYPTGSSNAGQYLMIANAVRTNVGTYSFKVRRKYDVVRAIKQGSSYGYDEVDFFDKFYDPNKGIYCRIQAWPESPMFTTNPNNNTTQTGYTRLNNLPDATCQPTGTTAGLDYLNPALMVHMKKRSYLKVDAPVLKGPFYPS